MRQDQDEEVKQLTQLRDSLRLLLQVEGKEVRSHITRLTHFGMRVMYYFNKSVPQQAPAALISGGANYFRLAAIVLLRRFKFARSAEVARIS